MSNSFRGPLVSLIVPFFNEEENLPRVFEEVNRLMASEPEYEWEVLMVDNASRDASARVAGSFCQKDRRWKLLRFTRNFGSEASLAAGLRHCSGDAAVVLFSDLQDPPSVIPEMLKRWQNGAQMVTGIYEATRYDVVWKRALVGAFYWVVQRLSQTPMTPRAADFRLYDRKVIDALNQLSERNRYLRGLAEWVGFQSETFSYQRRPRVKGKSKAGFFYLLGFAFSVVVNFSDRPLRILTGFGLVTTTFSVLALMGIVTTYWMNGGVPGLSTVYALAVLNLGFTALGLGLLGEYINKIYIETKGRPLYLIDQSLNLETGPAPRAQQQGEAQRAPEARLPSQT